MLLNHDVVWLELELFEGEELGRRETNMCRPQHVQPRGNPSTGATPQPKKHAQNHILKAARCAPGGEFLDFVNQAKLGIPEMRFYVRPP